MQTYIPYYNYPKLIGESINLISTRYNFKEITPNDYGATIENTYVKINISFKNNDFILRFTNDKTTIELIEMVILKYPDYFSKPELDIFKVEKVIENINDDFKNCLVKSFQFIEENYPAVFKGEFPEI